MQAFDVDGYRAYQAPTHLCCRCGHTAPRADFRTPDAPIMTCPACKSGDGPFRALWQAPDGRLLSFADFHRKEGTCRTT